MFEVDENAKQRERYANDVEYREKKKERSRNRYVKTGRIHEMFHGMVNTGTHESWRGMVLRLKREKNYIGMYIDPAWYKFKNFFRDMGERPVGGTIERIDNTKGYYKDNCRWATRTEQARNRSNNKLTVEKVAKIKRDLEFHIRTNKELADLHCVSPQTICDIKHGRIWKEVQYV